MAGLPVDIPTTMLLCTPFSAAMDAINTALTANGRPAVEAFFKMEWELNKSAAAATFAVVAGDRNHQSRSKAAYRHTTAHYLLAGLGLLERSPRDDAEEQLAGLLSAAADVAAAYKSALGLGGGAGIGLQLPYYFMDEVLLFAVRALLLARVGLPAEDAAEDAFAPQSGTACIARAAMADVRLADGVTAVAPLARMRAPLLAAVVAVGRVCVGASLVGGADSSRLFCEAAGSHASASLAGLPAPTARTPTLEPDPMPGLPTSDSLGMALAKLGVLLPTFYDDNTNGVALEDVFSFGRASVADAAAAHFPAGAASFLDAHAAVTLLRNARLVAAALINSEGIGAVRILEAALPAA